MPLTIAAQLLVTPTAQLASNGGSQPPAKRRQGGHGPTLADQVEHGLLPTPAARDGKGADLPGREGGQSLGALAGLLPYDEEALPAEKRLPTPGASDGKGPSGPDRTRARPRRGSDADLPEAVKLLPTPLSGEARHGSPNQHRSAGDTMLTGIVLGTAPGASISRGRAARLLPTPGAADADGGHLCRGQDRTGELLLGGLVKQLLPTPTAADAHSSGGYDPEWGHNQTLTDAAREVAGQPRQRGRAAGPAADTQWGEYGPAVHRWEAITGIPAPPPTEPGRTGPRLSPRFVEWMIGLDPGWVTAVPGLSRARQLRALGNGVVPHQALVAFGGLLDVAAALAAEEREPADD
jgi:DNA (cytosine-5)-methyltransferase 1